LSELRLVGAEVIDLDALKAAGVAARESKRAKVILSGAVSGPVRLKGVAVTAGARAAIEAAGGSVEEN
jgi:large subunit ribosomal protein L15